MKNDDKLKTLEDIELFSECPEGDDSYIKKDGYCVKQIKDSLKTEAIKWCKSDIFLGNENHISPEVKYWIKNFFNLTDEDLK